MARLVVSDMDGTLLNEEKVLSSITRNVLQKLTAEGIPFIVASGRSRANLLGHFSGIPAAMVTDNGGAAYDQTGKQIFIGDISRDILQPVLKIVEDTPYMHPLLCGIKTGYVLRTDTEEAIDFARFIHNGEIELADSYEEIFAKDRIVKLSINTGMGGINETEAKKQMDIFGSRFSITLSGDGWLDMNKKGVSKGNTLEILCRYLGYEENDVLVFGDYLNDLDMLRRYPKNSYCMRNGHPDVKAVCAHVTQYSNEEDGVARELTKIFDIQI